jgi:hypothetical protein
VGREKILRESGAALVAALDRESIYAAALDGIQKLKRTFRTPARPISEGSPERMIITAAVEDRVEGFEGLEINLHALPDDIRTPLLKKQPVEVASVDSATMQEIRELFGSEPKRGSVYYVPLLVREELGGMLVVSSDLLLPPELKDSIEILGSETALALESVELTRETQRRQSEERFRFLIQNCQIRSRTMA